MEAETAHEKQIKEMLGIDADTVLSDILNSFQDYIADGFDSLEDYVRSAFPPNDSTALKMLLVIEQLHNLMQESAKKAGKKLESQAKESIFYVPEELILCSQKAGEKVDREALQKEEEGLETELHALRANIASTRASCQEFQRETQQIDGEVQQCDISRVQAIVDTLGPGKENFSNDAEAVMKAGQKLSTLIPKLKDLSKNFGTSKKGSANLLDKVESDIQQRKQSSTAHSLSELCSLLSKS